MCAEEETQHPGISHVFRRHSLEPHTGAATCQDAGAAGAQRRQKDPLLEFLRENWPCDTFILSLQNQRGNKLLLFSAPEVGAITVISAQTSLVTLSHRPPWSPPAHLLHHQLCSPHPLPSVAQLSMLFLSPSETP